MDYYNLPVNKIFLVTLKALIVQDNKLLILKNTFDYKWEIPGGILEIGEPIEEGLKREVAEETALEISIQKPVDVWDFKVDNFKLKDDRVFDVRLIGIGFKCEVVGGKISLSDEHGDFRWVSKDERNKYQLASNSEKIINKCFFNLGTNQG
jgi:8-oxo-dGTP diphosphatase